MLRPVLVIGAGQAGLAAGYHLQKAGVPFVMVDAGRRIGDNWRVRYDSLTLFTPRQFSTLPGLEIIGNRELYPDRDEFAAYLESYAGRFGLPVRLGHAVARVVQIDCGAFEATFQNGETIEACDVIEATGGFQVPIVPDLIARFGNEVLHLTSATYRNSRQLPDGPVLIVGDGASGRDIAIECRKLQPVILAAGKPRKLFPERFLGKSIWWWLDVTGTLRAPAESWIGRRLKRADAFPDRGNGNARLEKRGVRIVPRLVDASGNEARFADGSSANVRTIIWAVGYRDDSSWLHVPGATDQNGTFLHRAGVSPVKGLYFVGRPWQRNRASALIMGAGPDAEQIVAQLLGHKQEPAAR
jgi:putative flavoprotein involved in K+ transport